MSASLLLRALCVGLFSRKQRTIEAFNVLLLDGFYIFMMYCAILLIFS